MINTLNVYLDGAAVGTLTRLSESRIGFLYAPTWIRKWQNSEAIAISQSLPVSSTMQDATAFVANLLPDSTRHRSLIAAEMAISDDPSDFAFLAKMGRDSAGALTIVPADETPTHRDAPGVMWLDEHGLANHLRSLPRRPLLIDDDQGVFLSLAGVNDKAAVVCHKGKIGLPRNGLPSTHIIKIDIPGLPDSIKTEHFCLRLAKAAGFRVPNTTLETAEDQPFMLMQRYDRVIRDGRIARVHQEDFCQALGVMPGRKYERYGGPSWADCFSLMSKTHNAIVARDTLLRTAVLQFLIGNPDAHAKNYSLVYRGAAGSADVSPLYDLNNAAAFQQYFKAVRPVMAMAIGTQTDRSAVSRTDWEVFSDACGLSHQRVFDTLETLSRDILDALPFVREACPACPAIDVAVADIKTRCEAWVDVKSEPRPGEMTV